MRRRTELVHECRHVHLFIQRLDKHLVPILQHLHRIRKSIVGHCDSHFFRGQEIDIRPRSRPGLFFALFREDVTASIRGQLPAPSTTLRNTVKTYPR